MAAVANSDFVGAIAVLEELRKANPSDLRVLNLYGIALTGQGDRKAANLRFQEALKVNPSFFPALKNLSVNQFEDGRHDQAKSGFEKVLSLAPADAVAHLYLGELASAAKDCAAATDHYSKAGARLEARPVALLNYARCLLVAGDSARAVPLLESAPKDDPALQFAAGALLARYGQPAAAAAFFGRARNGRDPDTATYNYALMLVQAGQFDQGIMVIEETIAAGRNRGEMYSLLASAYLGANRVKEAYEALRTAVRVEPRNERNYIELSNLCLDHDNYDLGLEITSIGLKNLPDAQRLYLQRGILYAMKGSLAEAEKDFRFATEIAPDDAVAHVALSLAWMQMGDMKKAIAALRAQAGRNKTDYTIPFLLGQALAREGPAPGSPEEEEALAALRRVLELNPRYAPGHAELGKLPLKRGDDVKAMEHFEECLRLDPENRTAGYQLAQVLRKRGEVKRSKDLLARVGSLNARDREGNLNRAMVRIVRDASAHSSVAEPRP